MNQTEALYDVSNSIIMMNELVIIFFQLLILLIIISFVKPILDFISTMLSGILTVKDNNLEDSNSYTFKDEKLKNYKPMTKEEFEQIKEKNYDRFFTKK